jgi:hypothetical protein
VYYGREVALEPHVVEIVEETGMSADAADA